MICSTIALDGETGKFRVIEGVNFARHVDGKSGTLLNSDGGLLNVGGQAIYVLQLERYDVNTLFDTGLCFIQDTDIRDLGNLKVHDPLNYLRGQTSQGQSKNKIVLFPIHKGYVEDWVLIQYEISGQSNCHRSFKLGCWNELNAHMENGCGHYSAYGCGSKDEKNYLLCVDRNLFSGSIEFNKFCFNISVDQDGKPVVTVESRTF